jgi:4-azaleucine resistance transporter AzlC
VRDSAAISYKTADLIADNLGLMSATRAFLEGCRDELPILLGTVPFGLIFGVLAVGAGLEAWVAQSMSSVIFAGSAQFIVTGLMRDSAPGLVIVLTILVVNLRHMLYSASIAPYLKRLTLPWKLGLAYLLTDEAYAVAITRLRREQPDWQGGHWYLLGASLTLWSSWQAATAVGISIGAQVPAAWSLDFTLALTFIALVFAALKDRAGQTDLASLAAALVAGLVAVLASGLPYRLGLMLAAALGIAAGVLVEVRRR